MAKARIGATKTRRTRYREESTADDADGPNSDPQTGTTAYTDYADVAYCRTGAAEAKCRPDADGGVSPEADLTQTAHMVPDRNQGRLTLAAIDID
jgi:hypothetical protein